MPMWWSLVLTLRVMEPEVSILPRRTLLCVSCSRDVVSVALGVGAVERGGDDQAVFRHSSRVAESFLCLERYVSYVLKENTAPPTK